MDRFSSKEKKASAAPGAASRKEKPSHQQQRLRTSRTLEATFVSAFCHALDCFPFSEDVVAGAEEEEEEDDDDADAAAGARRKETPPLGSGVATFLVPTARRLPDAARAARAEDGRARRGVRPPVALSILRLSRKLPRDGRGRSRGSWWSRSARRCGTATRRRGTRRGEALARMAAEGASLSLS